jgi:opacity protein-like surface antigen
MKKLTVKAIVALAFLFVTQLQAQDTAKEGGLFFSFNTGYNFDTSTSRFGSNSTQTSNTNTNREVVNVSFGKGINVGGAVGYMFNKNVGAELGINYLVGGKTTTTNTELNGISNEDTRYSRMLQFRPTLIISAGMDKINPYAKFGILIGSGSIKIEQTDKNSTDIDITKRTLDGGTAIGYQAGVGVSYKLTEKIALFGELTMVNMSYAPTKGKITESSFNGKDTLPDLSVSDIDAEFVDSINTSDPTPNTSPTKELKQKYAFGSFGFNFGLKYSL